jgi:hypothetical protein
MEVSVEIMVAAGRIAWKDQKLVLVEGTFLNTERYFKNVFNCLYCKWLCSAEYIHGFASVDVSDFF